MSKLCSTYVLYGFLYTYFFSLVSTILLHLVFHFDGKHDIFLSVARQILCLSAFLGAELWSWARGAVSRHAMRLIPHSSAILQCMKRDIKMGREKSAISRIPFAPCVMYCNAKHWSDHCSVKSVFLLKISYQSCLLYITHHLCVLFSARTFPLFLCAVRVVHRISLFLDFGARPKYHYGSSPIDTGCLSPLAANDRFTTEARTFILRPSLQYSGTFGKASSSLMIASAQAKFRYEPMLSRLKCCSSVI